MRKDRSRQAKPTAKDKETAALLSRMWNDWKRSNADPDGKLPTQAALIEGTGLSQSAVSQYLNGYLAFGYSAVLRFAKFFGVPPSAIRDDLDALPSPADDGHEWPAVLAYAQAVGLGAGREADEYAETHKLKFRHASLAKKHLNPDDLRVMEGSGDSMEPTIRERDAILFDLSDTSPRNNMIYVLAEPGAGDCEYNVKRCKISKGTVTFVADNPDGDHTWKQPRVHGNPDDPFTVIGRVRWIGRWIK